MQIDAEFLGRLASRAGLECPSVVVLALNESAQTTVLDPDRQLYPASMIKVPLAAALLSTIPSERTLDDRVAVTQANMTANDADSPLVPGYETTLEELVRLAIVRSDNVATNVLYDVLGRERATGIARERLSLPATRFARKLSGAEPLIDDPGWDGVTRNLHTAADAAALFAAVAGDRVAGADRLRAWLGAQEWNDKLSLGLHPGDRFLHKTGDTDEVTHDGGILHTAEGNAYVVVVYSKMQSTPEHNARFGPFMRDLRERL